MNLNIIIPMFNVEKWIQHNVEMLKQQSSQDFHCILINDMSTDKTVEAAQKAIAHDSRFELIVNTSRKLALRNIYDTIALLNPADEDVLILVDGDDALLNSEALTHVMKAYESEDCWMTYGSFQYETGERGSVCKPYPPNILEKKKIRGFEFRAAHLRTFRAGLWKQIKENAFYATPDELNKARIRALLRGKLRPWYYWRNITLEDIHDPSKRFFRRCYDKAIFFPMFELAMHHAVFIQEPLYLYRDSNIPLPYDTKASMSKWLTRCIRSIIINKPAYEPL